jgi:subtilisin family serine protease
MKTPSVRRLIGMFPWVLLAAAPAAALAQAGAPAAQPFGESRPIPGRYIVVFKDNAASAPAEAASAVRGARGQVLISFSTALRAFTANLPEYAVAALRMHPGIAFIEQDHTVSLQQVSPQVPATWGLDRIDQYSRILDSMYQFTATGAGVNAFIIDTGIRPDHEEFTGRLLPGYSAINDGRGTADCNGHGTHVAGTVGGSTWGVAKQVSLVPVRVLDCKGSGTWSGIIAGIDWVANSPRRPAVANMSLGGSKSSAVNAALAGAVAKGVTMVVAAGNNNANACNYSPASEPRAVTVGATASGDARAPYSNYGACVDLFAPGSAITSAWHTGSAASNTISGTSMASPHVAGAAALALQSTPTASPAAVTGFLTGKATPGVVTNAGSGSPNRLVYSLATGVPVEPPVNTVAVQALSGRSLKLSSRNWIAQATVTVRDFTANAVEPGATVRGSFAPGGNASCVTNNAGSCTLASASLTASTTPASVFTVTGITGTYIAYDASQNSAASVMIRKP